MTELANLLGIFVPLFLLMWIANVAEARRGREEPYQAVALVAYIFLALIYLIGIVVGLGLHVIDLGMQFDPNALAPLEGLMTVASLPTVAVGLWLPSLIGLLLLLPPVRRLMARLIPIDPDSPVHGVALALSMLVVINLVTTLGVGLDNLADVVAEAEGGGNPFVALWGQQILTAGLAMIGVGWLARRDGTTIWQRLGLVVPTGRQVLIGVGLGFGLVIGVMLLEGLAALLGLSERPDVARLTEELLGDLFQSPFGILTLGLAAALGEEPLFRGALLPRFGIVFTSLLFALVHSNYGITISTLIVFLLGVVLAYLRLRYNTTTSMVTHAVYNITLGVLAYLSTLVPGV